MVPLSTMNSSAQDIKHLMDTVLSMADIYSKVKQDGKAELGDYIHMIDNIAPLITKANEDKEFYWEKGWKKEYADLWNNLSVMDKREYGEDIVLQSIENPSLDQIGELAFDFKPMSERTHEKKKLLFVIVGLGGTGGYVIRDLSRFAYSILNRDDDYDIKIVCVDPDEVENKNLLRQNFMPTDLGKNKAEIMAARHSRAFGLEISSVNQLMTRATLESLTSQYPDHVPVIIGCVDNNKARREIDKFVRKTRKECYWIDSGNERTTGQVIMGSSKGIPLVTDLFPEVLEESADSVSQVSCAERLMQDEQNIFVNISAATHILNLCRQITLNEQSFVHGVKFNIQGKVDTMCLKQAA